MKLNRKIFSTELNGEPVTLEVSELAGQANASVLGKHGETIALAAVVMGKENKEGDFFPLTVDYEERFYAVGKIMGSRFIRREGRPSEEAILSARLVDRTIRPLFNARLRREVQVVITVLSYDLKNDPDAIALLAASTALGISDIPWNGPVGGASLNSKENDPFYRAFFSGPRGKVNMIEFEGKEIKENILENLFAEGQKTIDNLISFQEKIIKEIGKPKARIDFREAEKDTASLVKQFLKERLEEALKNKELGALQNELFTHLSEKGISGEALKTVLYLFEETVDAYVHEMVVQKKERPDGRALDEVRDLHAEVGLFTRTHGSGLFMRGNTQVLAVTTLDSPGAEQTIENIEMSGKKHFMLHYNFPSFSVGEVGRARSPGRREIGHGNLATKAIRNLLPAKNDFPYTIRIVAETLSSNGSSSMASTCAASLSLMDAGVPFPKHVGGAAMGLMVLSGGEYAILTDIQGPEDHYGDMDLKIAGTRDGITAVQMDTKIPGITEAIFREALAQSGRARGVILEAMEKVIPKHRGELSAYAPTILKTSVPQERIGEVIGPGGKVINGIIASTDNKVSIDIEEDGTVFVTSVERVLAERALEMVRQIVREYRVGETVTGTVVKVLDFGAIVDLGGGKDGMIHVSELKNGFVKNVTDVVNIGDAVTAKVIRTENGKIGLSMKQP